MGNKNTTYSEKLKDPRWQAKRLKVFERDGFRCTYCKDQTTTLSVHHLKYKGNPWDVNESDLVTVCAHCHRLIEHEKSIGNKVHVVIKTTYKGGSIGLLYTINEDDLKFCHMEVDGSLCSYVLPELDSVISISVGLLKKKVIGWKEDWEEYKETIFFNLLTNENTRRN